MTTTLIIGANRGIGLELARQIHAAKNAEDTVVATYRQNQGGLEALGIRTVGGIDIADDAGVQKLVDELDGLKLDRVIVVSGILRPGGFSSPGYDDVLAQFVVNSMGPLRAAVALVPQMAEGGKIALLTSRMGSVADNTSGGMYGYRMSKAALNAAGKSLALDLKSKKIAVALLHPGYVRTEMTGGNGLIDADESATLLLARIDGLTLENSGSFWHANGDLLPW